MSKHPASDDVAAALGAFVGGGAGPTHSKLTRAFGRAGYAKAAPYDRNSNDPRDQPNKEDRVRDTVGAAFRDPHRALELIESILVEFRAFGFFESADDSPEEDDRRANAKALTKAFARRDWELDGHGSLRPAGVGAVSSVEGRPAIEYQLERLRRTGDDPALMLGTAKEMLESTAKYVLDAFSVPYGARTSFDELWHHTRDRLGLLPQDVDVSKPGGSEVREILGACWVIARNCNTLRNAEGTGHGRTLPTGVTSEMALLVVREACSVAELSLATLDRMTGR